MKPTNNITYAFIIISAVILGPRFLHGQSKPAANQTSSSNSKVQTSESPTKMTPPPQNVMPGKKTIQPDLKAKPNSNNRTAAMNKNQQFAQIILNTCKTISPETQLSVKNTKTGVEITVDSKAPKDVTLIQQCGNLLKIAYQMYKTSLEKKQQQMKAATPKKAENPQNTNGKNQNPKK